jgi:hypothetical protein
VRLGPDGNLYLMDQQLSQVVVLSPDGEYLRTLSREGEGPGEVRRPAGMLFMPDGNLGLLQAYPGKIIQVTLAGDPGETFIIGSGSSMVYSASCVNGTVVVSGLHLDQQPGYQDRNDFLSRLDEAGQETVRYLDHTYRFDFEDFVFDEADMYFTHWRWTMDEKGRVFSAPERNRYAITVMHADGTVDRIIERQYESPKRTAEEMERAEERHVNMARNVPFPVRNILCDTPMTINTMHIAGDGSLWVLPTTGRRELPDDILRVYDVFDPDGHFARQVALGLEGCDPQDRVHMVSDDRVVVITRPGEGDEAESEPLEIICYAVGDEDASL